VAGASRWFSIPQPHGLWVAHGDPSKRTGCGQLALVAPEHKVSTRAAEALPCVGSAQERCTSYCEHLWKLGAGEEPGRVKATA